MTIDNLPQWNLSDLYNSIDDKKLDKDLQNLDKETLDFANKYKGKISQCSGDELYEAIQHYEKISESIGKIMSYAGLLNAVNVLDTKISSFYQNMNEKITLLSSHILFFGLEINKIEDDELELKFKQSNDLKFYQSVLDNLRVSRPHQLSDEVEQVLLEKSASGSSAWCRLFGQTMVELEFEVDKKSLNESEVLNLMTNGNESQRKTATLEFGRVLNKNIKTFSLITNTLAKDKEISDRLRNYKTPISSRNIDNLVEDEVVDALISSVKDNYKNISHRYYKLKAKWMDVEKLNLWDRNAPLPESDDTKIPYNNAVDLVLGAYNDFSPKLHSVAKKFFDNEWVDVGVRKGKRSGAFAHPCVPSVHPYLMLNYQGTNRDVMTLAHELGHGCHQVLASSQGFLKSQTPLTLAETASVFGEMLTFRKILDNCQDVNTRRILIAGKIEDMINTVVRQIAFCEFERLVHTNRKNGELSPEQLGKYWMKVTKESLGDAFNYEDWYQDFWAYIPHFIHSPFYVYSYAFGDCMVNSMFSLYQDGFDDFEEKYLQMLSSGGSLRHKDLLSMFNLDATKTDFWEKGLSVIINFIDEIE